MGSIIKKLGPNNVIATWWRPDIIEKVALLIVYLWVLGISFGLLQSGLSQKSLPS